MVLQHTKSEERQARLCEFRALLEQRIVLLDCAMGTMIQSYGLSEEDYRGERFADHPGELEGNNDLLSITQPQMIRDIHEAAMDAGSDIIETNTFSSTSIAQADYQTEDLAYELNYEAARIARETADAYTATPERPRFVAGALGPTNRTASLSPDVNNPGFRNITFDELAESYAEAARGLVEGGVDLLLVETVFDTLNAKAAIFGITAYLEEEGLDVPDHDLGHDHRRERAHALGAGNGGLLELRAPREPHKRRAELRARVEGAEAVRRGALPDLRRSHQRLPERGTAQRVRRVRRDARDDGGRDRGVGRRQAGSTSSAAAAGRRRSTCRAIAEAVSGHPPREVPEIPKKLRLSGLEPCNVGPDSLFVNVGERTNVTGSRAVQGPHI